MAGRDNYLVPLADRKDEPELLSSLLEEWMEDNALAVPILFAGGLTDGRQRTGLEPGGRLRLRGGSSPDRHRRRSRNHLGGTGLLIVRSYSYMKSELAGLRRRLEKAEAALVALTPPRQRGKKQIQTEGELLSAIEKVEKRYRVKGFFHHDYQEEVEEREMRGYQSKPSRVERKVRYQLTVSRNQPAIEAAQSVPAGAFMPPMRRLTGSLWRMRSQPIGRDPWLPRTFSVACMAKCSRSRRSTSSERTMLKGLSTS